MSGLPVVNYGRMERLKPPESATLPLNLNTICIIFIILCVLALYRRSVILTQERERYHT